MGVRLRGGMGGGVKYLKSPDKLPHVLTEARSSQLKKVAFCHTQCHDDASPGDYSR